MALCPECRYKFRTLDDEDGMHECPRCGYHPDNDREPPEPDGEAFRGGEAAAYEREQMAKWQRLK